MAYCFLPSLRLDFNLSVLVLKFVRKKINENLQLFEFWFYLDPKIPLKPRGGPNSYVHAQVFWLIPLFHNILGEKCGFLYMPFIKSDYYFHFP